MALMLTLDDTMKVLIRGGYIDKGYIDNDGNAECVKSELEQKCYYFTEDAGRCLMDMDECIGCVTDPNMICEHIIEGDLTKWLERIHDSMEGNLAMLKDALNIVRCKDCKWYVQNRVFQCGAHCIPVKNQDWFCADGELKEYEVK